MNSPIIWYGGKGIIKTKLMKYVTDRKHSVYVEPFGGGASILFAKKPVDNEVYNDINHTLFEFFTVLSDPNSFEKFYRKVAVLPYSRELFKNCCETWREDKDIIDRVSKWFVINRQSFGAIMLDPNWGPCLDAGKPGGRCGIWLHCIDKLPQIHARLQKVQIECLSWQKIFEKYDSEDTLFYLDPPYVHSTRTEGCRDLYEYEMKDEHHEELIEVLLDIKGQVVISGYENVIYNKLVENGWLKYEIETKTQFSKAKRIEIVWATPLRKNNSVAFF